MASISRLWIGIALALTIVAGSTGDLPSWAQDSKPCPPTTINRGEPIFGVNGRTSIDVLACASGEILIGQGQGLPAINRPSFTEVDGRFLGIVEFSPCDLPLGSDLPGANVTFSFVSANKAARAVQTLALTPDKEKPTLTTTSKPDKGTRVVAGQTIVVRMHASEQYGADRLGWQGGIKKIQLRDESANRDVAPHWEAAEPAPCKRKQWEQTLEVKYAVPPNPPPVIRLRAHAWDHAGNEDTDVGEFPTGEWYGRLIWKAHQTSPSGGGDFWGTMDLSLNDAGNGKLEGTLTGTQSQMIGGKCKSQTVAPGRLTARLQGSLDAGKTMSLSLADPQFTPAKVGPCSYGGSPMSAPGVHSWPDFANVLRDLSPTATGGFSADRQYPIPQGSSQFRVNLQRAKGP
ncbi:MAG: hypothetical protein K2Y71_24270 [Xanthobacteraceae bacterium]|nr:hypothetical protein [Xanthobacteraceae bacterium]